jgi:Flp pilus assembly protein TadD
VNLRLGRLDDAAAQLSDALDLAKATYGNNSPLTLRPKVTFAEVLGKLGSMEEAGELLQELVAERLPKDSVSWLNTLAAVYVQLGRVKEAEETYRKVVEDRRRVWGAEHPMTL